MTSLSSERGIVIENDVTRARVIEARVSDALSVIRRVASTRKFNTFSFKSSVINRVEFKVPPSKLSALTSSITEHLTNPLLNHIIAKMATDLADTRLRTKRQYQPSIDTYLHHRPSNDLQKQPASPSDPSITNAARHALNPLPHSVQSSLLSVGMRIRKAVPEGYKNQVAHEAAKPFDYPPLGNSDTLEVTDENAMPCSSQVQSRPAELSPMCGIHKIGGYGVGVFQHNELQNSMAVRPQLATANIRSNSRAAQSTLSENQQRAALQQPTVTGSRKRVHAEDEIQPLSNETASDGIGSVPMALDFKMPGARPMATAISRRKRSILGDLEQAQAPPPAADGDGMDFGEADFLKPL